MTIRDKQIEEITDKFKSLVIGTLRITKKEQKEIDKLVKYFKETIKDIIYTKDNELFTLRERLSLMINNTNNIKMSVDRILINDKKYVK